MDFRRNEREIINRIARHERRRMMQGDPRPQGAKCFRCDGGFTDTEWKNRRHRAYGDYHERCYREMCREGVRLTPAPS